MTTYALPVPRLVGADILKLGKNRSLAAVTAGLTVGAVAIIELLHVANPGKHGPAGDVHNLGHLAALIAMLGAAAAAIVGSRVGAGDKDAGVYRDLVVTGRSRTSLFLSRIPAGAAYLLPFVAAAYAVAAVSAVVLAGSDPTPGTRLLVVTGLWTPAGLGDAARQGPHIPMSTAAIAAVLIVWAAVAVVLAGWRDVRREA